MTARRSNSLSTTTRGAGASPTPRRSATTPLSAASPVSAKAKAPEPAPNLLDLDDFSEPVAAPPPNANKALPVVATHTEGTNLPYKHMMRYLHSIEQMTSLMTSKLHRHPLASLPHKYQF